MSDKITAPWTNAQIQGLMRWQRSNDFHSYTCGQRGESPHAERMGDEGGLTPTRDGWVCEDCDYTQDWAHAFSVLDEHGDGR